MKNVLLIGLLVAVVLIVVGGAGIAYAQFRNSNQNVVATVNRFQFSDKVVPPLSNLPGGMMGIYRNGNRTGGMMDEYAYGPGGMMGEYGYGYGPGGMMGEYGYGYGPGGMMGGRGFSRGEGPMHDYMVSAFADAVDLTADEVENRLENGETFQEIAIAQGTAVEDFPELITQVHQVALDQAVADGVITQAQADFMLEHMNNFQERGFVPGYGHEDCPMWDEQ